MKKKKILNYKLFIHLFFIVACIFVIIPMMYVVTLSFTPESSIQANGYTLIPEKVDFTAYKMIFENPKQLIDAYKVTAAFSLLGTFLSLVIMSMASYALSRQQFAARNFVAFFIYFTMLFSGGLIPKYIINTRYLHLGDSFWAYVFPSLAAAYYIIVLRTFFKGLPSSLVEAAKLDGANEFRILWKIMIPLSKPALATIALLELLGKWNNWQTSLLYITNTELYSLQYLLQRILKDAAFMEEMAQNQNLVGIIDVQEETPIEGMRFAMAMLAAGPMLVIFPFFQKYFTRGLTLGSVKG